MSNHQNQNNFFNIMIYGKILHLIMGVKTKFGVLRVNMNRVTRQEQSKTDRITIPQATSFFPRTHQVCFDSLSNELRKYDFQLRIDRL